MDVDQGVGAEALADEALGGRGLGVGVGKALGAVHLGVEVNGHSVADAARTQVVDAPDAGDGGNEAGYLLLILLGRSIVEAHQAAVDTAAFVCSSHVATPSFPTALLSR